MTLPDGWRERLLPGLHLVRFSDGQVLQAEASVAECDDSPGMALTRFRWTCVCGAVVDTKSTPETHRRNVTGGTGEGGGNALQQLVELPDESSIPDEEPSDASELQQVVARGLEQMRAEFEPPTWTIFERTVVDHIPTDIVAKRI